MTIPLAEPTLALIDGKNYAVLATINADGSPQTSVIWIGRDDDGVLFTTVAGRVKHRNVLRDPRVSITVIDSADPEYEAACQRSPRTSAARWTPGCPGNMTEGIRRRTVPARSGSSSGSKSTE